jgi:hypothetical protein
MKVVEETLVDLVALSDDDRAVLRAASARLESQETPAALYLAGRLAGLAGRIPAELDD